MQLDLQFIDTNTTVYITKDHENLLSYGNFTNLYATNINGQIFGYTA